MKIQEESLRLLEKSFKIRKNILGDYNPDTLESINSVGTILTALGKLSSAEPLLRAALVRRKEVLGVEHLSVAESDHALAVCLLKQRRLEEARQLLYDEILVRKSVLGDENPIVARVIEQNQNMLSAAS